MSFKTLAAAIFGALLAISAVSWQNVMESARNDRIRSEIRLLHIERQDRQLAAQLDRIERQFEALKDAQQGRVGAVDVP